MRLKQLSIRNYRTVEALDLDFPSYYTAICGRNDAGKTNIVRVLRTVLRDDDPYGIRRTPDDLSLKDDFPKWSSAEPEARKITVVMVVLVSADADAGLYQFLNTHLTLEDDQQPLEVRLTIIHPANGEGLTVEVRGQKHTGLKAQEVLKKIQTSNAVLFWNSTEFDPRFRFGGGFSGFLRELAGEYSDELRGVKETIDRRLKRVARGHQRQLTELLGRLEGRFRPALSVPTYNFEYLPFTLSLGHGKVDVALNEWGSGTRNRTLVLLTLFRARQISESGTSASKVTPVLVIEEPESFLHPSAQAEFGRVLQELADEFRVQVIATTHSPYLLSQARPESNILLERETLHRQHRGTFRVDTGGDRWMEPFGAALGIDCEEFRPWRDLFFSKSSAILLVEGDTDKEYFELLKDEAHGAARLLFPGEIFAYFGKDTLKQTVLLKFIKDRYRQFFITYDLDAATDVERTLISLRLEHGKHYYGLGINAPGRRAIEGFLPDSIKTAVNTTNSPLVDQAMNGSTEERRSARNRLKQLYLAEFKAQAKPGDEFYGEFYKCVKAINRAFAAQS